MAETHVSSSDLTVADLKKEIEKRGLSKSGNKAQLCDRLEKCLEKEGQSLDSVFGAQVCEQKTNAAISGLDLYRWCSQIAKKDPTTTTIPAVPPENVSNPVVSPQETQPLPQQQSQLPQPQLSMKWN